MQIDTARAQRGQSLSFYIPAILLFGVGVAITAFDAVFMAQGAVMMAPASHSGPLLAGVAICAAIFKAGWLSAFRLFLLRRWLLLALAALGVGLLTHVFSMTATIGVAATGRETVLAGRSHDIERHRRALTAYDDARVRKAAMPATRPVSAIRAELATVETEIAEQAHREAAERASVCGTRCTDAIRKGEAAKESRASLRAELETALDAARAETDLAAAKTALDGISAPGAADPQAAALAAYVPVASFTEREAALMLPLLPSLIVEFGGPISLLIAGALWGFARQCQSAPRALMPMVTHPKPTMEADARLSKRLPALPATPKKARLAPVMSGAEITALRAALGEGQEAFAMRFGVDQRTVRRWENGERVARREVTLKARALAAGLQKSALAA